jgi:hypothetical protein
MAAEITAQEMMERFRIGSGFFVDPGVQRKNRRIRPASKSHYRSDLLSARTSLFGSEM